MEPVGRMCCFQVTLRGNSPIGPGPGTVMLSPVAMVVDGRRPAHRFRKCVLDHSVIEERVRTKLS